MQDEVLAELPATEPSVISFSSGNSLLNYLNSQGAAAAGSGGAPSGATLSAAAKAKLAGTTEAALQVAGSKPQLSTAGHALEKQQAALAGDLRAAMGKAGVRLAGTVEFAVSSDGKVNIKASEADKAATTAFLKADASQPSFAMRMATQAKDALQLSGTIQRNAAMSQAARYGGNPGGAMSMYTSLMQQASTTTSAVFSFSATTSALTYPGSLAAKA